MGDWRVSMRAPRGHSWSCLPVFDYLTYHTLRTTTADEPDEGGMSLPLYGPGLANGMIGWPVLANKIR